MANSSQHPLSPHLQVYRLPFTALISITHRATGAALSIGALLMVGVLAAAAAGADYYAAVHAHLSSWYGYVVLIGFTFALFFHACNGVRHLFWDIGWGFELETVDKTAKMVIGGAVVLTVVTWLIVLSAG